MDPTELVQQPGTIETAYAVLAAVGTLVTGIAGTVLAFLKLGVKSSNGKHGAEVKALPVLEGWNELREQVKDLQAELAKLNTGIDASVRDRTGLLELTRRWDEKIRTMSRQMKSLTENHADHERYVSELHSGLLDPEKEVQRRLMVQELRDIREAQKQILVDVEATAKGQVSQAEATATIARMLKELSQ